MNTNILIKTVCGSVLMLLASCTSDNLIDDQGNTLPEGKYPLEIGSISLAAEADEQPWRAGAPQTRVTENGDGNSSHWETDDVIYAKTDGAQEAGTFRIADAQGSLAVQKTTYWTKTTENVTAWYPAEGTVELADQSNKLAYVLQAVAENASYNQTIELGFTHQLAKVRVTLQGDQAKDVTDVKIKSYTTCTHTQGAISTDGATEGWITMMKTERNGATCWEANVMPDYQITEFQVNGVEGMLKNGGITPLAAKVNTIMLTVGDVSLQPVDGKFTINQGDDVLIKDYDGTAPIVVNGDATITIENVKLTTDGTVMEIAKGADVTLNVKGTENKFISTNGSGIGAYENSNINIVGNGADGSKLTVASGDRSGTASDNEANVGIGFLIIGHGSKTCGNIIIDNVTLDVTTGSASEFYNGAAIGLSGRYLYVSGNVTCGDIKISNSNIVCKTHGTSTAACIGANHWNTDGNLVMGGIYIENSTITATSGKNDRGDYGACIGLGCIENRYSVTMKRIEIDNSTLNLTSVGDYKVGKGKVYATAIITEGIFVDGNDKGKDGWNP